MKETVILLHGILKSSRHMKPLEKFLIAEGYSVQNIDYPSTKQTLEELTEIVWKKIKIPKNRSVHFIGYSMGGLLVRAMLSKYSVPNLGRVIQLATPNGGSEVADVFKNFWFYKKIFGPAGQQLITDQKAIQKLLGKVNYDLGIIAGTKSIDPFSSFFLKGQNDGKVSVEKTKIIGMKAHTTVSVSHLFFPRNKKVHRNVLSFLKTGKF